MSVDSIGTVDEEVRAAHKLQEKLFRNKYKLAKLNKEKFGIPTAIDEAEEKLPDNRRNLGTTPMKKTHFHCDRCFQLTPFEDYHQSEPTSWGSIPEVCGKCFKVLLR